jgi:hypothetical protein
MVSDFAVVATCGGTTNVNGTYFQSTGFPATYNRSVVVRHFLFLCLFTMKCPINVQISRGSSHTDSVLMHYNKASNL